MLARQMATENRLAGVEAVSERAESNSDKSAKDAPSEMKALRTVVIGLF